jgi:hypothetical protein
MAQFDKNKEQLMLNNRHLYEVVMMADKDGNIINNGGSLSNINLASGLVEGYSAINKFGFNLTLGNNGFESIWDGSNLYTYPTNATVAAVTGNAPGAVISIQGLDENYNLIVEAVPVGSSSIAQFIRVFRASVIVPPIGADTNEHDITITVDGIAAAKILADNGQTLMSIYTIPAGKTGYLTKLQGSVDKSTDIKFKLMAKPINGAFNVKGMFGTFGVPFEYEYTVPLRFTEKTDIEVRAQSGNSCGAGATFDIILIDNV